MALSSSVIIGASSRERIIVPGNGIMDMTISYTAPNRQRNASMSIAYRVTVAEKTSSVGSASSVDVVDGVELVPSKVTTVAYPDVHIQPAVLGDNLYTQIVSATSAMQTPAVVYRRVDVQVYNGISLDAPTPTTNPRAGAKGRTVNINGTLQMNDVYRYKCGAALVGQNKTTATITKGALAFLAYGGQNPTSIDKPSRFLVTSVPFHDYTEAIADPNVEVLIKNLQEGFTLGTGSVAVKFTPVVRVQGRFREVAVVQLEGVSRVAGMRLRNEDV